MVFSVDDNFTTTFMTLLNRLPVFPIYYEGKTKFTPIHRSDLTDLILHIVKSEIKEKTVECVGPEVITFKDIIKNLLNLIDKKRLILPMPLFAGKIVARIMELTPKPLLTRDQLKLLSYDNVISNKYESNSSLGVPPKKFFLEEVKKYSFMWKDGGQFSTDKYLED